MTLIIIIITAVFSIAAFSNSNLMQKMIFNPYIINKDNQYHRFLTSGFIHGGWLHLIINMLVLFSFGASIEQNYRIAFGDKATIYYLLLYIGGLIFSDITTYLKHKDEPHYNSLGASGAVSAVLFAHIVFEPLAPLYIWGILPLPGILLGVGYLVYSAKMADQKSSGINHDAHLYGAVFGFLLTILLKPSLAIDFFNELINIFK